MDNKFPALNLPAYEYRIRLSPHTGKEEIFDSQRHKYVRLTQEEWVRQHFVHFLINILHYPAGRIGNEVAIKVGQTEKRCDSVVFDVNGLPHIIVEYKAASVVISQKVFDQIARYNMALKADYLVVSNGLSHYCCRIDHEHLTYEFIRELPHYQESVQD